MAQNYTEPRNPGIKSFTTCCLIGLRGPVLGDKGCPHGTTPTKQLLLMRRCTQQSRWEHPHALCPVSGLLHTQQEPGGRRLDCATQGRLGGEDVREPVTECRGDFTPASVVARGGLQEGIAGANTSPFSFRVRGAVCCFLPSRLPEGSFPALRPDTSSLTSTGVADWVGSSVLTESLNQVPGTGGKAHRVCWSF
ncbi:hypothetical protein H8959_016304 [Pygathrix nigripes]